MMFALPQPLDADKWHWTLPTFFARVMVMVHHQMEKDGSENTPYINWISTRFGVSDGGKKSSKSGFVL